MSHSHHHTEHHHGHHHHELSGKNLGIAIFLNILITLFQIVGALISRSLSLFTDALHNLSDVMALVISWVAHKLAKRKFTAQQSFGYKRAEIIAAFINASTLLAISVYLIIEAIQRLSNHKSVAVNSDWVIGLAAFSIVANGLSVVLVQRDAKHSMNMKAAYLHLFSDMLTSIGVLVGGILMKYWNVYWVDSVLSILIAIYLIISSWKLVLSSLKVLMQFAPEHIHLQDVVDHVIKVDGVKGIHHVHIWQLSDNDCFFEAHIETEQDLKLTEVEKMLRNIEEELTHHFAITHVTLQPGFNCCEDKSIIKQEQ